MNSGTPGKPQPACVVGAYALAPHDPNDRHELLTELTRLPGLSGFELPLGWLRDVGELPILRALPAGGRHVLTAIGAQAGEAARDPRFGLASTDPAGRRRAVELIRTSHEEVLALAAEGIDVVAVEVHSWPSVEPGRAPEGGEPLADSLAEIASWAWGTTAVVLEHCDARVDGRSWQKGLLPLTVEVDAVEVVRASEPSTRLGMAVNWGRSAIEGRTSVLVAEHVRTLHRAGLLHGVVLAGAAARDGAYGPAWSDVHLPLADDQPESLMDRTAVQQAIAAGTPSLFTGIKVAAPPGAHLSVSRRVDLVRHVLDALSEGAQGGRHGGSSH